MEQSSCAGLERGVVRPLGYTSLWVELYREEEAGIKAAIGNLIIDLAEEGSVQFAAAHSAV
jgi:hypothetical protein